MSAGNPALRQTVFRLAFVFPWLILGVTTLAIVVFGAPSRITQLGVFAASIVAFGLPHGAVDHRTPPWARDEPMTPRWLAVVGGLYLVVGLAYVIVWFVAPVAGFVSFVLLTWFHWGEGELHPLVDLLGETHLQSRTVRGLTLTARGALPMALPLVAFPADYRWVAERLVGLFGTVDLTAIDSLFTTDARAVVAVAVGSLVVASLVGGVVGTTDRRTWMVDAGETLLLVACFLLVPPILAVGVFFCCWHSVRHIVRLLLLDETSRQRLADGDIRGAGVRFARQATPLSVGALVVFGGLALVVPVTPADPSALFAVYLVGIAVVTAPHVVIVTWLDVESGIWKPTAVDNRGSVGLPENEHK